MFINPNYNLHNQLMNCIVVWWQHISPSTCRAHLDLLPYTQIVHVVTRWTTDEMSGVVHVYTNIKINATKR